MTAQMLQTLYAPGVSGEIPIFPAQLGDNRYPVIMATVADGAALTYQIEGTIAKPDANGVYPQPGRWVPLTFLTGLSASQDATIQGKLTAVRARYLTGNGTLTLEVGQG